MDYQAANELAKIAQELLKMLLESKSISFTEGIQHGGGTITSDSIDNGEVELAFTKDGKIEIVDRAIDAYRLYDHKELSTMLEDFARGSLSD